MFAAFVVGVGGFFGAMARFAVTGLVQTRRSGFPVGTLTVNVLGSFVLGFLATAFAERVLAAPELRLLALVGFLGSFTTFSTFSYETVMLAEDGQWRAFILNITLNFSLCLIGTVAGVILARLPNP